MHEGSRYICHSTWVWWFRYKRRAPASRSSDAGHKPEFTCLWLVLNWWTIMGNTPVVCSQEREQQQVHRPSGNWGHSAQPLYNGITFFLMWIHMHHSDTHTDQVSYFMGEFILTVMSNQLDFAWSIQPGCLFLSCKIIITPTDEHDQKLNPCLMWSYVSMVIAAGICSQIFPSDTPNIKSVLLCESLDQLSFLVTLTFVWSVQPGCLSSLSCNIIITHTMVYVIKCTLWLYLLINVLRLCFMTLQIRFIVIIIVDVAYMIDLYFLSDIHDYVLSQLQWMDITDQLNNVDRSVPWYQLEYTFFTRSKFTPWHPWQYPSIMTAVAIADKPSIAGHSEQDCLHCSAP